MKLPESPEFIAAYRINGAGVLNQNKRFERIAVHEPLLTNLARWARPSRAWDQPEPGKRPSRAWDQPETGRCSHKPPQMVQKTRRVNPA
jgi:hypothetical protein